MPRRAGCEIAPLIAANAGTQIIDRAASCSSPFYDRLKFSAAEPYDLGPASAGMRNR